MKTEKKQTQLKLRTGELTQREDFGTGIARIDLRRAAEMGIEEGDIIEIRGKKSTPAVAMSSYASDEGADIIRIDGITRRNTELSIGDEAVVKKAKYKDAKKLVLTIERKGVNIHLTSHDLNRNLLMRPFKKGDIIIPNPIIRKDAARSFQELFGADISQTFFSQSLEEKFLVVSTVPEGIVRVVDSTDVELVSGSYTEITELDKPYQERVINVRKHPELKNFLELRGIEDIKKFINAGRLVNRYEDEKFIIYFVDCYFFKIQKL